MFRSLRSRLLLSHILPSLIITPLMGIALIYILESQLLLPDISKELIGQANLLAETTRGQEQIWSSPESAQALLDRVSTGLTARAMFIAKDGKLIASSDPADQDRLNQVLVVPGLEQASLGQTYANTRFSQRMDSEVIDVFVPVLSAGQSVSGIVRLSHRYSTVVEEIIRARNWILGVMLLALLAGIFLGLWIAVSISRPLSKVTQTINDLTHSRQRRSLAVNGPSEIQQVLLAVNYWMQSVDNLESNRRRLLANLVHELGRPIGALYAAIQALQRGAKNDPNLMDELLTGMVSETDGLRRLIDDLAELHDQDIGSLELALQDLPLSDWLPRGIAPWKSAAEQSRLEWQEVIPQDLPQIQADPLRLNQIIGNLLANAIKYTPAGGKITITAWVEEPRVKIRVSDTGLGIGPDEQDKIFLPFYRGSPAGKFQQGMGLGLSIAQNLAAAHGGWIELDSLPGRGSDFTLNLPLTGVPSS